MRLNHILSIIYRVIICGGSYVVVICGLIIYRQSYTEHSYGDAHIRFNHIPLIIYGVIIHGIIKLLLLRYVNVMINYLNIKLNYVR